MDLKLRDRICLVTGASTGIGRASAVLLAAEGAQVVATARSHAALAAMASDIQAAGGPEPILLTADFADKAAPETLAGQVLDRVRQVDVLVNNAGASRPMSRPDDDAAWQEALQINFVAARRLAEAFIPSMVERGWGRIINLTGAILGKSFNASASAKAALESWSRAASGTYAAHGITVNCVAPGRLNTAQILQRLHPTEESRRDFIARNIPAGRFGEPEEAAALIAFLASDRASYITGTAIPVDGGTMRLAF